MVFTSTGCKDVVVKKHFRQMKDGAVLANFGHFNVEVSVRDLEELAIDKKRIRNFVDEYKLQNGNRLYLIGEGRLANLVVLGGHPSEIMDLSFSVQALTSEYLVANSGKLVGKVYEIFQQIDEKVARSKLETMNVDIDVLTNEQRTYLENFEQGT